MYDLHRLRLLRELSHRGTLAAVADALGYSPSSISHQLSLLERETGVPLLEPAGRGVRLTPAAAGLVSRVETIMLELERAEADIAAGRTTVGGVVRIATFQTVAHTLVLDAIDWLAAQHPQLVVTFAHVNADAAIPALIARDYDLVLSESYPGHPMAPHPGVTAIATFEDPLLLAIPAEWEAHNLADLADAPWVMEHPGTAPRAWSTSQCRDRGFEPVVRYETADLGLHAAIVARGRAAAFLPQLGHQPMPGMRTVSTGSARRITLAARTGTETSPAIRALGRALTETGKSDRAMYASEEIMSPR